MNDPKYDLLTDSCFFEFLPTDGTADETHPLTLDQLEEGKEYEIVITNLSGFYRYRIKDVIRVLGRHNTTPQVTFAYRMSQMVNIAAEKTTEEHLAHAVAEFSKAVGCAVDDYCLYIDYQSAPARYVLLVEPDRSLPVDKLPEYGRVFDEKLRTANVEYSICRDDRSIGIPWSSCSSRRPMLSGANSGSSKARRPTRSSPSACWTHRRRKSSSSACWKKVPVGISWKRKAEES